MFVFDNVKLFGVIYVCLFKVGEQLKFLNGNIIMLVVDVVLIVDEIKVFVLGGIMGGDESGVIDVIIEIFFESVFFVFDVIVGKVCVLNFFIDFLYCFECGVDFSCQIEVLECVIQLVLDICGGVVGLVVEIVLLVDLLKCSLVCLCLSCFNKVIGMEFMCEVVEKQFKNLCFFWLEEDQVFLVMLLVYCFDIEIEEDLIEEIVCFYGYDNILVLVFDNSVVMLLLLEVKCIVMQVCCFVVECDYQEVVNFSFVEVVWEKDFVGNDKFIVLVNLIVIQMGVMCMMLIGGLVNILFFNFKCCMNCVCVFEIGCCFWCDVVGVLVVGFQ